LTEAFPCDYVMGSWFMETHPESFFVKNIVLSKFWEDKRCIMFNQNFKFRMIGAGTTDEVVDKRVITTQEEYLSVLREYFDLSFPDGTVICPPGVNWQ